MRCFLSFLLTALSFLGCKQGESNAQNQLPTKRPIDMRLEVREGGGMLPESRSVFISADSCFYEYHFYQAHNRVNFRLTAQELDELYAVLLKNQVDKIKTEDKGTVHDRGGEHITLTYNRHKNRIAINNAGGTFIVPRWIENYRNCLKAVYALQAHKTAALSVPFTITLDKSITESGKLMGISIEDAGFSYHNEEAGMKPEFSLRLLIGEHHLAIHLVENTQPAYSRKIFASAHLNFSVTKDKTHLLMYLEKNKLNYKWQEK